MRHITCIGWKRNRVQLGSKSGERCFRLRRAPKPVVHSEYRHASECQDENRNNYKWAALHDLTRSGPNYSAINCGIIQSNPIAFEETTGQKPNHSHRSIARSKFGQAEKITRSRAECDTAEALQSMELMEGRSWCCPFPRTRRSALIQGRSGCVQTRPERSKRRLPFVMRISLFLRH
jgi:hypothetical protein